MQHREAAVICLRPKRGTKCAEAHPHRSSTKFQTKLGHYTFQNDPLLPVAAYATQETTAKIMILRANDQILRLPRVAKRAIALAVDIILCVATVAAAFALRLDGWTYPTTTQAFAYGGAVVFAIPLFISFGLYRAIFRYAGWGALVSVVRACVIYALVYSFVFTAVGIPEVPRTVGLIQPALLLLAIGASRAFARSLLGGGYQALLGQGLRRRVLIYGAGSAGRQLAAALANSSDMHLLGFVDDDPHLRGSLLNGKRIYGGDRLYELIEKLEIDDLLLAVPSATRKRRAEIIDGLRGTHASIRTLPGLMDIAHGRVTMQDLRELDIIDLLGREAVPPNTPLLARNITGKVVMVTGAGGSIGSELCRQIIELQPTLLLLVEFSEFNLYAIDQELEKKRASHSVPGSFQIIPILASVQDEHRMAAVFEAWKPNTVYHAAAYKHVPLVEHNPAAGVRNNVFGTLTVARLARDHGTQDFVLISTDKAVRPTNVMGTSKRLAELVLQAMASESDNTRFSMVRFGNVLGSSGSVVPLFRQQIKAGGPLTITHKDITRYFMTIPEAAQLVIQAGAMASGGEVFLLDMGEPVKIIDLAQRMIELSGLSIRDEARPDGDIEIRVVGLRPGEKLYEELLIGENPSSTSHPRIMKGNEHFIPWRDLEESLNRLDEAITNGDVDQIVGILKELVPEAQQITDRRDKLIA